MESDDAAAHKIEFVDRAATHGFWVQLFSIACDVHRIGARLLVAHIDGFQDWWSSMARQRTGLSL